MAFPLKDNKTNGLISILFVMLIWGSAFTVTKLAVELMPPFFFAFLRNILASLILLPLYLMKRKKEKQSKAPPLPYLRIVFMALAGITVFYSLFNLSLIYTAAATGALIQGLMPVAIAIPAVIFLKEKIDKKSILGIIISVIGVILLGFIGNTSGSGNVWGNILMIGSVLSWAIYTLISKSINQHDPIIITSLVTFIGTALLLPPVIIELWGHPLPSVPLKGWLAIGYLGIFSSAISYVLYNKALKTISAAQAGNFMNLDPVIGAVIAVIFLKERFTNLQLVGGVLVLIGIWLSFKTSDKPEAKSKKA